MLSQSTLLIVFHHCLPTPHAEASMQKEGPSLTATRFLHFKVTGSNLLISTARRILPRWHLVEPLAGPLTGSNSFLPEALRDLCKHPRWLPPAPSIRAGVCAEQLPCSLDSVLFLLSLVLSAVSPELLMPSTNLSPAAFLLFHCGCLQSRTLVQILIPNLFLP